MHAHQNLYHWSPLNSRVALLNFETDMYTGAASFAQEISFSTSIMVWSKFANE
jgi:hypothetical protein